MNIIIKFIVPKWKSSTELYYNAECRLWDGCAGRSGKQPGMVWYSCQIACAWVVAGAGSISSQCMYCWNAGYGYRYFIVKMFWKVNSIKMKVKHDEFSIQ